MDNDLQEKLFEKYPLVFADRLIDEAESPFKAYGIECGNGWFEIIDNLCASLEPHIRSWQKNNPKMAKKHPRTSQVKEKIGGLRFYLDYPCGWKEALDSGFKEEEIIGPFEQESYNVCEFCGKDGEIRNSLIWILTLCESCYDKRKNDSNGD